MALKDNYQLLVEKLDQFIRKYYVNKLIRGALYSTGLILILFLGISLLENYFYFEPGVRKVMFYSFLSLSFLALAYWVFSPLLSYFRLGKIISHEQAANIIGDHFGNVKDKLLNILQLKKQSDSAAEQELILASIDQKSEEIKLVPFKSAINLGQNRKHLRYALPPLLLLLIILFAAPSIIKDSANRLIKNNKKFERPAPFSFAIDNENLEVVQFEDFPLSVSIEGEQLPNEVFIDIDNYQYRLSKEAANRFSYRFSNVQKNLDFRLFSPGVESEKFTLEVLKKPNILGFDVKLDYPAYTGRKDEELKSIGDLVLPVGTNIDWIFNAQHTDDVSIQFGSEETESIRRFSDDLFTHKRRAMHDELYKLFISNDALPNADSISYAISVIPDLYPSIQAEKFQDSLDNRLLFFVGEASDDYGLMSLSFNYRLKREGQPNGELTTIKLDKSPGKQIQYSHTFDLNELALKPGDEVAYFFEVYDNDAVNGAKSARTNLMLFNMPTAEEFEAMAEANDEQIKSDLQKALEESRKIQEDMKKMREKLLQEKEMDWQSRKELEKLLERQKELEKQIEDAKEAFEENLKNQDEFTETEQEIMEKQEQLQKLFEEVMDQEMQELMKQIEELMQKMEKDEALEMMEDFKFSDEEMEMELDRLLELFKQLELEQEMMEAIDKLEELAKEQEDLSELTEQSEQEHKEGEEQNEQKEGEQNQQKEGEQNEQKEGEQNQQKEGEQNEQKEGEQNQQEQNKQGEQNEQKEGKQNQQEQGKQDKPSQEDLEKKQEEINQKFEDIKEQMEEIDKKNEELESPRDMGDNQEQMEDIQQDLNNSQQQLQQQQNKKASQSQKKAAQKMQQMAQGMQQQMQAGQMQQMEEDMASLRQLLENLVGLSFDQEDLIDDFNKTSINTPKYVELVQDQFKLKDDFRLIQDSLQALSKRVFQIESYVTEKVADINRNMEESLGDLEERQKPQASDHQQRTMKNVNDLALMLSEVMNQMQQQMSAMMSGSQMCTNPGNPQQQGQGQPKDKMSQGQKSLNQQLQDLKKRMEQQGQGPSSEEFAKMAARQAALRKALREKQKEMQQQGQGNKQLQELIEQMDKVETDLVNKKLTNEMMKRQQDILTRLLEHEKAERQREFDEKRKAETAQQKERKLPPSIEEYLKKRESEIEMYKTVSPSLKPYYKILVEEYFKSLKPAEQSGR